VCFTDLIGAEDSRTDLIITFLAVLELFRALAVRLEQDVLFGEIWLTPA
jgi:chromatin segregation and condensation protein Rec8/ScpA/Scc1 (kleisin family)